MDASIPVLEAMERDAWADMIAAAPPPFAAATGLAVHPLGTAVAFVMARVDNPQFNRLHGLGVDTPATEAELDAGLKPFRDAGLRNFLVQLVPDASPPALAQWIAARGLVAFRRAWAKLRRGSEPAPAVSTALRIAEVGAESSADFARVVCDGFGMPPPMRPWLAAMPGRAGWRAYLAYAEAEPISAALLYIRGRVAWYGAAATIPAGRRRGGQRAILARCIADAIAAGCTDIVAETGEAVPGEPNPSYENMLRSGFSVAYARANFTAPPSRSCGS
jgi:hypothetical protein